MSSVSSHHSASDQTRHHTLEDGGTHGEDVPSRHQGALQPRVPDDSPHGAGGGDGTAAKDPAHAGQAGQAGQQGGGASLAGPGRVRPRERRVRSERILWRGNSKLG